MSRDLLTEAVDEVETAKETVRDSGVRDRLETLAGQLQSQARRETTPALGALDRIRTKLGEIGDQTDETAVAEPLERARDDILSFLETLDDRGMSQHGGRQHGDEDGPA